MPRVSLLELPARFGEPEAQLARARALVRPRATDLVVLPEAALTGYVSPTLDFDLRRFAEPLESGTARLHALAAALDCDVVGPVIEREGNDCFNSVIGVSASGLQWLRYRKRHPWYPETWATAGTNDWPLVEWRGLKLTCAVCFDVHFLDDEATAVLEQADVLVFPSAWVEEVDSRAARLSTLAARYNLTVLNANWGPGVPAVSGQGGSLVARPDGSLEQLNHGQVLHTVVMTSASTP